MSDLYKNHVVLLLDKVRMSAYRRAIERVVKPGMVVADIGCGLGALAYMALEAGASRVYAIEVDKPTLQLAKVIAEKRGEPTFSGKNLPVPFFIEGLSYKIKLPEKVDVVVSETLGNLGVNENIVAALRDAKRFLKRVGRIIPERLKVWTVPVENKKWISDVKALGKFLPDDPRMPLGISSEDIGPGEFLAEPRLVFDVNIPSPCTLSPRPTTGGQARGRGKRGESPSPLMGEGRGEGVRISFKITRNGILSGFAGWFEAILADGIGFATSPDAPPTHWKQAFLPLRRPEGVRNGDIIEFDIVVESRGAESVTGYEYKMINPNFKHQNPK